MENVWIENPCGWNVGGKPSCESCAWQIWKADWLRRVLSSRQVGVFWYVLFIQSSIYLEPETSTLKWLFGVPGKTKLRKIAPHFESKGLWCGNHRADGLEHSDVCCKSHCTGLAPSPRAERPWGFLSMFPSLWDGVRWVGERSFHHNAWSKYRNGNHAANHFHHLVTFW